MIFSLGQHTSNTTQTAACLEILAPPGISYSLLEIMITNVQATAQSIALGRSAAVGIGGNSVLLSGENTLNTGQTTVSTTWTTPPTQPAKFNRRLDLAPTVGAGAVWTFLNGLLVPAGSSVVLWNISVGSPLNLSIVIDE